ncbi:prion-like-(Q/N-rich) domain-bearing protein 25 isoform X2 [Microplitis demolitor]|uniref:prion-like-(Q/N-rich) domain-bearing protein 25 isoform X2 n=1 Tax=Microplitis demolitor TaxID=69319 RepID=UPI0004CD6E6D|nr:prion-like-(Q/N-rich) domain-bearing protein 25 isoform X2 [Microplitis demolitor]
MMLILSGILSVIVAFVDPFSLSTTDIYYHCVIRNALCDPNVMRPCCDQKDICKQIGLNAFKCIENVGLGKICRGDEDCNEIWHSKCSKEKTCVCRTNNIKVNETTCAPVLGGFCWNNELCATDNAVCIDSECQCNGSNHRRFNDQCIFNTLGAPCESDENCEHVRFAKCSERKVCSCSSNTSAVNQHHCAPLIGGFCWTENDCLPLNSICVDNSCQCMDFYVSQSNNRCIPVRLSMTCTIDQECNWSVPHSICFKNKCICEDNYFKEGRRICASYINIYCSSNNSCILDNSLCIENMCQCKPGFVYHSSKCIPPHLNGPCRNNNDCDQIQNARCSADNVCVCNENHTQFNERICRLVPKEYCLEENDCQSINFTCIMNECQCKPHFVKRSRNLCELSQLGMGCEDNNGCIDILKSKCSVSKKCECISNYVEYNITACMPLLGSYCSENQPCATLNSICSNNICVCSDGLVEYSNNKCTPHYVGKYCMKDEDCKEILNSKCVNNDCSCKANYVMVNITACAPLLGEYCKNNQQCAPANSICNNNKCQCDSDYVRRFNNKCIPKIGHFKISCYEDDDCLGIKYAICSTYQKCVCQSNYVALGDDKCVALIGEYCESDEECISYNTVCIKNKCQCPRKFVIITKYQCDRISLGRTCHKDDDCDVGIKNSVCSNNNTCVCREKYYALNEFDCEPFLHEYCLNNEECSFNLSICIENKCQCKDNFQSVSASQCKPIDYMYECNKDLDCGDPWHIKCFPDKKCRCNSNNISINRSTCLPLLKGYCWRDSQCFVRNSACIDYQCKCKKYFVPVSGNLCLPV